MSIGEEANLGWIGLVWVTEMISNSGKPLSIFIVKDFHRSRFLLRIENNSKQSAHFWTRSAIQVVFSWRALYQDGTWHGSQKCSGGKIWWKPLPANALHASSTLLTCLSHCLASPTALVTCLSHCLFIFLVASPLASLLLAYTPQLGLACCETGSPPVLKKKSWGTWLGCCLPSSLVSNIKHHDGQDLHCPTLASLEFPLKPTTGQGYFVAATLLYFVAATLISSIMGCISGLLHWVATLGFYNAIFCRCYTPPSGLLHWVGPLHLGCSTQLGSFTRPIQAGVAVKTHFYWRVHFTLPYSGTFYSAPQGSVLHFTLLNWGHPNCWLDFTAGSVSRSRLKTGLSQLVVESTIHNVESTSDNVESQTQSKHHFHIGNTRKIAISFLCYIHGTHS